MSKAITKTKRTINQDVFCYEWVQDRNGARAAIAAGYSEKTAASQASRLLKNVNIQKKIKKILDKVFYTDQVKIEQMVRHLIRLTNYDISTIFDEKGLLLHPNEWPEDIKHVAQGVEVVESSRGYGADKEYYYTHKIKMPDRTKSAELLSRYLRMFVETVEHRGEVNLIIQPASQDDGGNGKLLEEEK